MDTAEAHHCINSIALYLEREGSPRAAHDLAVAVRALTLNNSTLAALRALIAEMRAVDDAEYGAPIDTVHYWADRLTALLPKE